ncbi:MAG: alkaline phosphatase family protein [Anaerolineaceae bacterium]
MKNALKWIVSILLLVGFAVGAYFWATAQIASNFNYRSLIKDNPPQPGTALGTPSTERMVIVLIDALRYDTSLKSDMMPTLSQLRSQGASALMHSQPPSFSEPGYSTILTGAWPDINDGPAFNLDYEDIPTFTQDNLFSSAHRLGWKTAVSGYYWFEKLIPQTDVDFSFYTPGEDNAADIEVMNAAIPWLQNNEAKLVLIHLDQVDYAGHHEGGPQSANWDAAATRADTMLAEVVSTLDFTKDTLVIFSDHGQIDAGGHGGQDPACLLEPFVIVGAGVNPGQYPDIQMVDIAPTLSAMLGINLPASTQGEVQTSMLSLPQDVISALPGATGDQQLGLLNAYSTALGQETKALKLLKSNSVNDTQSVIQELRSQKLFGDRVVQAIPTGILLAVAVALLIRQRKNQAFTWLLGGILFVALFNLRYLLIDHKVYSLSSIISQTDLIVYIATSTAVALVLVWLVVNFYNKTFGKSPNENGLKTLWLGFTVILVAGLPVLASFFINGPVVTWTLPDYLTSFLALIGLIQILIISALTPILAGLTAGINAINRKFKK